MKRSWINERIPAAVIVVFAFLLGVVASRQSEMGWTGVLGVYAGIATNVAAYFLFLFVLEYFWLGTDEDTFDGFKEAPQARAIYAGLRAVGLGIVIAKGIM